MLENQILTIGLDPIEIKKLKDVGAGFLFITVPSQNELKPHHMKLQGLIFKCTQNPESWNEVINAFVGKCVVGISDIKIDAPIKVFNMNFSAHEIESFLNTQFTEIRTPPDDVGEIKLGRIVKSKVFPTWGLGVVVKIVDDNVFEIRFPNIPANFKNNNICCHKTQLRIICDIKEIGHD